MKTGAFTYDEFTTRNIGFVTEAEQQILNSSSVFVCGTGGMGGAAVLALARAGIGRMILADIDAFETSNLNRQVFAFTNTIGSHKAEATAEQILMINPDIDVEVYKSNWCDTVHDLIRSSAVTVNGTDDLGASLLLYRVAREIGRPIIDAYASPLPSIYVTRAGEQTPEERLEYPTIDKAWDTLSEEDRAAAFQCEALHVLIHSSSRHHIDLDAAGEVAAGRRSRMSFAPMVITTGMLMAYETISLLLDRKTGTDNRGWFFNPYKPAIEKPKPKIVELALRPVVRRMLARMMSEAA
ncbi:MAG: ThiF family adenylyltransferase [Pseudomonadota bacterium]